MNEIVFTASFGDEKKTVRIINPDGGGEGWQVTIDYYFRGTLFKREGQWVCFEKWLNSDDVQILGEMIDGMGVG